MSDKRMGNNIFSLLSVEDLPEEPKKAAAAPKAEAKKKEAAPKPAAPAKAAAPAPKPAAAAPKPAAPKAAEAGDFVEKPAGARQHHVNREDVPIRPGKKVYERHSAPGRGRPAPKEGHNSWGTAADETREPAAEEKPKEGEAPAAEGEAAAEEKPKEPAQLDLKAYLAQREATRVQLALPEARKAGEGVEMDPEWEKAQPLEREEDEFYAGKGKGKRGKAEKKEAVAPVPLSQFLADSEAGQRLASRIEKERRDRSDRQRRERMAREDGPAAAPAPAEAPKPKAASPRARAAPAPRAAPVPKVDDASFPSLAGGKKTPPQAVAAAPAPAAAPAAQ